MGHLMLTKKLTCTKVLKNVGIKYYSSVCMLSKILRFLIVGKTFWNDV